MSEANPPRTISVSGTGRVDVTPDLAERIRRPDTVSGLSGRDGHVNEVSITVAVAFLID